MWHADIQDIEKGKGQKFSISEKQRVLTFAKVIEKWQNDAAFRTFFITLLADAPFRAFFWETPPVTRPTRHRPFEFVLIDSPALANVEAVTHFFEKYFKDTTEEVITFPNLGKDALLVVPSPVATPSAYPHLAAFMRNAPQQQIHTFWQQVGEVMEKSSQPVWLSTSGLGVYWVHIRLDSRPKYYQYRPYKMI